MKINKKSLCDNKSSSTNSGSKSGCGCGSKHGTADEYEIEETEVTVSE